MSCARAATVLATLLVKLECVEHSILYAAEAKLAKLVVVGAAVVENNVEQ